MAVLPRLLIVSLALVAMLCGGAVGAQQSAADTDLGSGGPDLDAETKCMALTVYWEARTESTRGQSAIAHTVLNRQRSPAFPDTVCGVVSQQSEDGRVCQFSWWCDGRQDTPTDMAAWDVAIAMARQAMAGGPDPSGHALYFHNVGAHPSWSRHKKRVARIGNHIFYR